MKNRGFTLVELVTVMIILGILAAYVAPRFFLSTEENAKSAEIYLTSLLRLQQQRAMQDTSNGLLYGVSLKVNEQALVVEALGPPLADSSWNESTEFAGLTYSGPEQVVFNSMGCIEECGLQNTALELFGISSASICINAQGYIASGRCF